MTMMKAAADMLKAFGAFALIDVAVAVTWFATTTPVMVPERLEHVSSHVWTVDASGHATLESSR